MTKLHYYVVTDDPDLFDTMTDELGNKFAEFIDDVTDEQNGMHVVTLEFDDEDVDTVLLEKALDIHLAVSQFEVCEVLPFDEAYF